MHSSGPPHENQKNRARTRARLTTHVNECASAFIHVNVCVFGFKKYMANQFKMRLPWRFKGHPEKQAIFCYTFKNETLGFMNRHDLIEEAWGILDWFWGDGYA